MPRKRPDCDAPPAYTLLILRSASGLPRELPLANSPIWVNTSKDCESSSTVPPLVRSSEAYRVGFHSLRPRPAVAPAVAPLTPTRCTDAPIQVQPLRTKKSPLVPHSVSMSWPAVTFCQSTTAV